MIRPLIVVSLTAAVLAAPVPAEAQSFRGGFDPGRMFGFFDRNGDGQLDDEEIARLPGPFREWMEQNGIDGPIFEDEFIEMAPEMMEDAQQSGSFGSFRGFGNDGERPFGRGGFGDRSERGSERGRRDGGGRRGRSSSEAESSAPKPPERINPLLPRFTELDLDGDGQIGLHEWRRARRPLEEFYRLDLNGDGFITPRELMIADTRSPSGGGTTIAAGAASGGFGTFGSTGSAGGDGRGGSSGSTGSSSTGSRGSTGESGRRTFGRRSWSPPSSSDSGPASSSRDSGTSATAGRSSGGRGDLRTLMAESSFRVVDKDNDGTISAEEWAQSDSIRERFERAGVELTFPVTRDAFVEAYPSNTSTNGGSR